MKAHFVEFFSPGTFVDERTSKSIKKWDIAEAKGMAFKIKERYGATPYGFQFYTMQRKMKELNAKEIKRSVMYYLGGKVETLAEVKARATKDDAILVSNMECNNYNKIITNTNSWKHTSLLQDDDVVLDWP